LDHRKPTAGAAFFIKRKLFQDERGEHKNAEPFTGTRQSLCECRGRISLKNRKIKEEKWATDAERGKPNLLGVHE